MQAVLDHSNLDAMKHADVDAMKRVPTAGTRIDSYQLIKHLQQGGMSSVYLGYDLYNGTYVAIKIVDGYTADMGMFYREVEIMQALEHEHIVPCLDTGQWGRYHYLVMPYMRGGTLEDMFTGGIFSLEEALSVLEQLASALTYMHSLGLLHRDIKPTNILFDQNYNLYLTDLGIVTWLGEKSVHRGHVMGTPHYMAPELFGGHVDQRCDVYSVGILLYQMLTGYLPFDGASDWRICLHHQETQPPLPTFYNPSLPRSVERVLLRALEKNPQRRYQTIDELLCAFRKALEAPRFFEQFSTQCRSIGQKLRNRLTPDTSAWQPARIPEQI